MKIVLQHIPPQRIAAADFERTRKLAVSAGVATRKANGDVEYFLPAPKSNRQKGRRSQQADLARFDRLRLLMDSGLPLVGGIIRRRRRPAWSKPTWPGDTLQVASEAARVQFCLIKITVMCRRRVFGEFDNFLRSGRRCVK